MSLNEITEASLKHRIAMALDADAAIMASEEQVARFYEAGKFHEFVGIVGRATQVERTRAAQTATRLGHRMTAAQIARGK